jgi:hypothetical protein
MVTVKYHVLYFIPRPRWSRENNAKAERKKMFAAAEGV